MTPAGDALYGVAPVLAALAGGRRTAHALYIQEGGFHSEGFGVQLQLCAAAVVFVMVARLHADCKWLELHPPRHICWTLQNCSTPVDRREPNS
jgi:hypothetical protein